ncbi:hypothetical protein [Nitrososphaera sp.]|uniref:hypothetical protein n=1 Tax=Nitrososphaera sp. TaxID=1971748 RepID=UPI00307EC3B5
MSNPGDGKSLKGSKDDELLQIGLQGMTDNAQMAIAVAIGIFGVLAISVELDQLISYNAYFLLPAKVILSVAYFGLVLLGVVYMAHHRLFNMMIADYSKKKELQDNDKRLSYEAVIRSYSDNPFSRMALKYLWTPKEYNKKIFYALVTSFIVITFLMWIFIFFVRS